MKLFVVKDYILRYGTRIDRVFQAGDHPPYSAVIECLNSDYMGKNCQATIQFDSDVTNPTTTFDESRGRLRIFHKTDIRHYPQFVDMLRNENPVAVFLETEPPRAVFLSTSVETPGEGSPDPD